VTATDGEADLVSAAEAGDRPAAEASGVGRVPRGRSGLPGSVGSPGVGRVPRGRSGLPNERPRLGPTLLADRSREATSVGI
jgi:hypothetical protein